MTKIKKAKKQAEQEDSTITGWDLDREAGIFWAEYPTDGPFGNIVGVLIKTGEIEYKE